MPLFRGNRGRVPPNAIPWSQSLFGYHFTESHRMLHEEKRGSRRTHSTNDKGKTGVSSTPSFSVHLTRFEFECGLSPRNKDTVSCVSSGEARVATDSIKCGRWAGTGRRRTIRFLGGEFQRPAGFVSLPFTSTPTSRTHPQPLRCSLEQ